MIRMCDWDINDTRLQLVESEVDVTALSAQLHALVALVTLVTLVALVEQWHCIVTLVAQVELVALVALVALNRTVWQDHQLYCGLEVTRICLI